jgi:hypothetical protein
MKNVSVRETHVVYILDLTEHGSHRASNDWHGLEEAGLTNYG